MILRVVIPVILRVVILDRDTSGRNSLDTSGRNSLDTSGRNLRDTWGRDFSAVFAFSTVFARFVISRARATDTRSSDLFI